MECLWILYNFDLKIDKRKMDEKHWKLWESRVFERISKINEDDARLIGR